MEKEDNPKAATEEVKISAEKAVEVCSSAVKALTQKPYYHLVLRSDNDPIQTEIYCDGGNYLVSDYDGTFRLSSALKYNGRYAVEENWNYVLTEETPLDYESPIGATYDILQQQNLAIQGVEFESENIIRVDAKWDEKIDGAPCPIRGSFTYEFFEDGRLFSVLVVKNRDAGEAGSYSLALENLPDTQKTIQAQIENASQQIVYPGESSGEPEKLAVPPSNETAYDLNFLLGCDEMKWSYFGDSWAFALSGEGTSEGITLVHTPASDTSGVVLEYGGEYFLESWDGECWNLLFRGNMPTQSPEENLIFGGDSIMEPVSIQIHWDTEYGTLEEGRYRVGMYDTAVRSSGEQETKLCYAKFLVRSPEEDRLVQTCTEALKEVLESPSYHVQRTYYMPKQRENEDSHYYVAEIWKSRQDHYQELTHYYYSNGAIKSASASLLRDGKGYSWNTLQSPDKLWQENSNVTEGEFRRWLSGLECTGKTLESVEQKEDSIQFYFTYASAFPGNNPSQGALLTYNFDSNGELAGITLKYLYGSHEKMLETELVIKSVSNEDAEDMIRAQNPTA